MKNRYYNFLNTPWRACSRGENPMVITQPLNQYGSPNSKFGIFPFRTDPHWFTIGFPIVKSLRFHQKPLIFMVFHDFLDEKSCYIDAGCFARPGNIAGQCFPSIQAASQAYKSFLSSFSVEKSCFFQKQYNWPRGEVQQPCLPL